MRSPLGRGAAAVLIILSLAAAGSARPPAGRQETLRALLPADGAVPGWSRDGETQEFVGEDLFTYIDGGAEIYQEYGFSRVVAQDYKSAGGTSVSLELFEMATPAAAYGMFTFKRSGQGTVLPLGAGAEIEDYYLNLWQGRFLVTLTGFDASAKTVEGLKALATAAAGKLSESAPAPALVAALPVEGLRPQSLKYLKGLLGLNNVCPFYTARGLTFKDAIRGLYESGETLLILEYDSIEARHAAWLELKAGLEKSGRFEQPDNYLADAVVFRDGKGQYYAFSEVGPRLAVGIHDTLDGALRTVGRVR
jgi:Family of unknown function (DUF6599)